MLVNNAHAIEHGDPCITSLSELFFETIAVLSTEEPFSLVVKNLQKV